MVTNYGTSPEALYTPPGTGIESGGRAPNGRGFSPFEEGDADLSWENLKIEKKLIIH